MIANLGERFPTFLVVPIRDVPDVIAALLRETERYPNGSSFLVDSDAPMGMRRIWMDNDALVRLEEGW